MTRIALAMIFGGLMLAYTGYEEHQMASLALPEAQTMTCQELAENGPGANAHITLSNFDALPSYIYEGESPEQIDKVWIPLARLRGETEEAIDEKTPFNVILRTEHAANTEKLNTIIMEDSVKGLVVNQIDSLSGEELQLLRESYPNADINACWILDHNREPSGGGTVMAMMGGGGVLSLLGAALGLMLMAKKD